jgi:2'-5' RNA ligase
VCWTERVTEAAPRQRLFFALWPPGRFSAELQRVISPALQSCHGRRLPDSNYHITLAFLGPADATQRRCAEQVAAEIRCPAFDLPLEQFGYWPKPGVVWLAPRETPAAYLALVTALASGLQSCGFAPPQRPNLPHLTLMRKVLAPAWAPAQLPPIPALPAWRVDSFSLVESVTLAAGAQYRVLRSWQLVDSVGG